jgi:alkanesulfonate monooxygenase SsuD/methylene tetrahydromethanopterin reductase-like flavin-dependent oxidoreductase (luciferase family)
MIEQAARLYEEREELTVGTPDDVREYCRNLIETLGSDGGFILGPSGQTEDVKIENVQAMVDSTR